MEDSLWCFGVIYEYQQNKYSYKNQEDEDKKGCDLLACAIGELDGSGLAVDGWRHLRTKQDADDDWICLSH